MAADPHESKKFHLAAILLAPLVIAFLYPAIPVSGINTDVMWRFNVSLPKDTGNFLLR